MWPEKNAEAEDVRQQGLRLGQLRFFEKFVPRALKQPRFSFLESGAFSVALCIKSFAREALAKAKPDKWMAMCRHNDHYWLFDQGNVQAHQRVTDSLLDGNLHSESICRNSAVNLGSVLRSVNFAKVWTDLPLFAKSDDEIHGADLQDCHGWPVWQILVALCIRGKDEADADTSEKDQPGTYVALIVGNIFLIGPNLRIKSLSGGSSPQTRHRSNTVAFRAFGMVASEPPESGLGQPSTLPPQECLWPIRADQQPEVVHTVEEFLEILQMQRHLERVVVLPNGIELLGQTRALPEELSQAIAGSLGVRDVLGRLGDQKASAHFRARLWHYSARSKEKEIKVPKSRPPPDGMDKKSLAALRQEFLAQEREGKVKSDAPLYISELRWQRKVSHPLNPSEWVKTATSCDVFDVTPFSKQMPLWERSEGGIFVGERGAGSGLHVDQCLWSNVGRNWCGFKLFALWPWSERHRILDEAGKGAIFHPPLTKREEDFLSRAKTVALVGPGDVWVFSGGQPHTAMCVGDGVNVCAYDCSAPDSYLLLATARSRLPVLMSAYVPGDNLMLLRVPNSTKSGVPISVCGRLCYVSNTTSLANVQSELQAFLGMHEQEFDLSDSAGKRLVTDQELQAAVQGSLVPLQAGLSDASVHLIENRREELAQMQWKVLRDKLQGCNSDVLALSTQVSELQQRIQLEAKEREKVVEALRADIGNQLNQDRAAVEANMHQLSEQIHSFSSLVNAEQNKREYAHKVFDNQVQDLRNALDADRADRRQESDKHLAMLREGTVGLDAQRHALESVEQRHMLDLQNIRSELAQASRKVTAFADEQLELLRLSNEELARKLKTLESDTHRKLAEVQAGNEQAMKNVSAAEAHSHEIDARLSQ
ncbi:unnamed protein product, partial [Symbiodinium necroappetens]